MPCAATSSDGAPASWHVRVGRPPPEPTPDPVLHHAAQGPAFRFRAPGLARTDDGVPSPSMTYSIVALDPATGDLGVAVQSKFLAVGAVVPWAQAGVGAVATQSFANVTFGPGGLARLASGMSAT